MYAEAANEYHGPDFEETLGGQQLGCYPILKLIRKRAGIDPGADGMYGLEKDMTQKQMRQAIQEERRLEFAFEGHRWFDLRRSTRPRLEKVLDGTRYVLEENDARYTLAIPKEAIEANPGLLN